MSVAVPPDPGLTLSRSTETLFRPFRLGKLDLANRIVMAPMTRSHSPGGVPGPDVAAYYRRRAEGGVGLIVTEGTYVPHPAAGFDSSVPRFYGADALDGWRQVAEHVHAGNGRIFPQLWHVGVVIRPGQEPAPGVRPAGPSGLAGPGQQIAEPMTQSDIDAVVEAFGKAAHSAQALGFDGVELHGAHGYLIDQFFWEGTNQRTDRYGGDLVARTRFAVEVIQEVRRRVGPDFPVVLRFSQWKLQDFDAKLARTPQELEKFLSTLAATGVDAFHCSTRRFWEPEFQGSDLNLAGWTKKADRQTEHHGRLRDAHGRIRPFVPHRRDNRRKRHRQPARSDGARRVRSGGNRPFSDRQSELGGDRAQA